MELHVDREVRGSAWPFASVREEFLKDYGFVAIKKNTGFNVPSNGAGEDNFLQVAAFSDEIFDCVAVRDADDVLFDDRAVVQDFGNVVAGCPDQLYAALKGLMIRACAHKCRQERVVNVDDALRIAVDEVVGENLHVTGENHEI